MPATQEPTLPPTAMVSPTRWVLYGGNSVEGVHLLSSMYRPHYVPGCYSGRTRFTQAYPVEAIWAFVASCHWYRTSSGDLHSPGMSRNMLSPVLLTFKPVSFQWGCWNPCPSRSGHGPTWPVPLKGLPTAMETTTMQIRDHSSHLECGGHSAQIWGLTLASVLDTTPSQMDRPSA